MLRLIWGIMIFIIVGIDLAKSDDLSFLMCSILLWMLLQSVEIFINDKLLKAKDDIIERQRKLIEKALNIMRGEE